MIIHGDSLVELKKLADNSVDSIVCDPPYERQFYRKKKDLIDELLKLLNKGEKR